VISIRETKNHAHYIESNADIMPYETNLIYMTFEVIKLKQIQD